MVSNIDALKQREWQFEALVQSLDDLVLEIDEDLRLTKVWTQDETKLLRPKIQLIGSSVLELLGQDGTAMLRQALEGLSDHKRATSIEYFHVAHNRHFKLKLSLQKRFGSKRFFTIVQSDITHEKSVQADKDRISNEISQFFEVTLEMLAIIGFEGQFKKINPQWGKVLGYAESELQNTFFIDFVHPDDLAMTIAVLAKIRSGISIQSFENRYRAKDGSYRILNWSSSIDLGTRLIFAAAHDVTESRKGEVRLKQLMAAIDRSALVALTDALGRIIDVNQYFCEVSEYTREEMVGRDLSILNSGAHSKEFYRQLWSTIASGKPWTGQIENKAKSGKRFFVQSVISPIVDVTGGQTKYLGIYLDVTKQVESERQLSEAQSLASLGSWHLERVTSHLTWSAELYHIYEIDPAAPGLLENYRNCISPQDFSRLEGAIHCAFETGKGFSLDHKILLEGGSRIKWVRCLGEPELDFDKVVIAVRGTYQDITKLTLSEQSLQLEKAKTIQNAKLASLGEMSAGIAHEINNPLAIIAGTVQSLPKFLSDPEKLRKKIEIIEKSAERIAKIVNGLRKFSRTSDRPDRKHCRIDRIIEETLIMTAAKAHRHLTQVEVLGSEEAWILCDEIEIEQVLINLINNAIDAVKTSDQRWVQISLKKEASMTVVLVRDSGKGLPKEVKERLFQPFFTTKPVGEGTGLGLSIARGILKEHDASLMLLEDDPHTCFEIRFQPIVDVPRAA
jgi:PAS domain S-box-containing protein